MAVVWSSSAMTPMVRARSAKQKWQPITDLDSTRCPGGAITHHDIPRSSTERVLGMITGLAWIVAITIGFTMGGAALHFPGSYGSSAFDPAAGVFGLILGAVNGLFVGVLAWVALLLSLRAESRVVAMMAVMVGVTHGINDGSSTQLPFAVYAVVACLVTAGAARWILGERRPVVLAVIGGAWAIGLIVGSWSGNLIGLPLTETQLGWAQDHGWDGLVAGLVWGIATAATGLPQTIRRQRWTMAGGSDGS